MPTQAQRRLLGNLIVGGMLVRLTFEGQSLRGPRPALQFVSKLNERMIDQMIAFGWLERAGLGLWSASKLGQEAFDSGKVR